MPITPRFSVTQAKATPNPLADALLARGARGAPRTTLEGLGKLAQLLSGAYVKRKAGEKQLAGQQDLLASIFSSMKNLTIPGQGIEQFPRPEGFTPDVLSGTISEQPGTPAGDDVISRSPDAGFDQIDAANPAIGPFSPPTTTQVPRLSGQSADLGRELLAGGGPPTAGRNNLLQALLTRSFGRQDTEAAVWAEANKAKELARINAAAKAGTPLSRMGKLVADLDTNLIDQGQFDIAIATMNKPLVDLSTANKIDEKLLEMDIKQFGEMQKQINTNAELVPRMEVIAQALESGNVETGRYAEAILPLQQWAQSLGWRDDKNLPQKEQVASAMAFMIPRMRVPGSGATSDSEMDAFKKSITNYANTTEGNIILARTFLQLHARQRRALSLAQQYLRDNKSLTGFDKFAEETLGPLFPKPTTQAEYDDIEARTVYLDTDGRFKVKR
jgi:hypothetical protein